MHLLGPGRHVSGALHVLPGQQRSIFIVPHVHSQPFARTASQSSKFASQAV
jgi:hypothetical protein